MNHTENKTLIINGHTVNSKNVCTTHYREPDKRPVMTVEQTCKNWLATKQRPQIIALLSEMSEEKRGQYRAMLNKLRAEK